MQSNPNPKELSNEQADAPGFDIDQASPWVARVIEPRVVLALFTVAVVLVSLFHTGHGVESTDIRTYVQMIAGVARHGLPYWDNGPIDKYDELVVPWAVPREGHLWGVYAPLYAYVSAPAFKIGGLTAVSKMTAATLAPNAIVTYLATRRFVKNAWFATLAGVLVVMSTPLLAKAVEMSAYPLSALASILGTYYGIRAFEERRGLPAIISGISWGAAIASHALCFPMALSSLGLMGLFSLKAKDGKKPSFLERFVPGTMGVIGLALALIPIALLNHRRFGSFNPLSYGPIVWRHYDTNPIVHMNVTDQLVWGKPVLLLFFVVVGTLILVRKNKLAMLGVLAAGLAIGYAIPTIRAKGFIYAQVVFGYVIDLSLIDIGWPFTKAPDGIGQLNFGMPVLSTVQCTPLLLLAPLFLRVAKEHSSERAQSAWIVLIPCIALYFAMALRANMGFTDAFGIPWLFLRYTVPVLPMLTVASVVVLERASFKFDDLAISIAVALVVGVEIAIRDNPDRTRRILIIVVPVIAAVLAYIGACFSVYTKADVAKRLARPVFAIAIGVGMASSVAMEFRTICQIKGGVDAWLDHFVAIAPQRFAIFGVGGHPDDMFTTTVTHDVRYACLFWPNETERMKPIFDLWRAEGRPIYMVWDGPPPQGAWGPEVTLERINSVDHLYLLHFTSPLVPAPQP